MKSIYYSLLNALQRNAAGVLKLPEAQQARMAATLQQLELSNWPSKKPSAAVLRPIEWHQRRVQDSWRIPEGLLEELKTPKQGALGLGEGPGLSNGAKRAVPVQDGIQPVDNSLVATIIHRPGTTHIKVIGRLTALQSRGGRRGEIRSLTPQARARNLELIRELEQLGYMPDHMMTLTYPSDWRGALSNNPREIELLREKLAELNSLRILIQDMKKTMRRINAYPPQFQLVEHHYRQVRRIVRNQIATVRSLDADGDMVKRHLKAFLKRFDRKFGNKVLATFNSKKEAEIHAQFHQQYYPAIKVLKNRKGGYDVIAVLYRIIWWLEFQRRGAPHLHFMFFDVKEIDWTAVRSWIGQAWAGVVHGIRNMAAYQDPALGHEYDQLRELWGREVGESIFGEWLEQRGLALGVWRHMRAGTRVEKMRKRHWGYAAKEGYGGRRKQYQKTVPKRFRNVGRWWGYRNYKRAVPTKTRIPMTSSDAVHALLRVIDAAKQHMPSGAFRYRKKLERTRTAIAQGELYAYLTVWGQGAQGAIEALAA